MTSMKARIKWVEDRTFIGESGSGHKIVLGTASGAEGHRFKSCQAHQQTGKGQGRTQISATHIPGGPLAQLVEQLTLNQRAVGSTPTRPTKNQPLTNSFPSSQSSCRRSVGSKTEKIFFLSLSSRASTQYQRLIVLHFICASKAKIKFRGKDSWRVLTLKRTITEDRDGVRRSEIWNRE